MRQISIIVFKNAIVMNVFHLGLGENAKHVFDLMSNRLTLKSDPLIHIQHNLMPRCVGDYEFIISE
jgi:hypothetical protein